MKMQFAPRPPLESFCATSRLPEALRGVRERCHVLLRRKHDSFLAAASLRFEVPGHSKAQCAGCVALLRPRLGILTLTVWLVPRPWSPVTSCRLASQMLVSVGQKSSLASRLFSLSAPLVANFRCAEAPSAPLL